MLTREEHEKNLEEFFQWLDVNILQQSNNSLEKVAIGLGWFIGSTTVAAAYFLGSGFGAFFAENIHATKAESQAIQKLLGSLALISTSTLYSVPTMAEFKRFASYLSKKPTSLTYTEKKSLHYLTAASSLVIALFSGVPFFNLLNAYFKQNNFLSHYLPFQVIVNSMIICHRAQLNLIDTIFINSRNESAEIKQLRLKLKKKLDVNIATLKVASLNRIQELYSSIKSERQLSESNLLQLQNLLTEEDSDIESANVRVNHNYTRLLFAYSGFIIGAISCYTLYLLALDTSQSLNNTIEVPDELDQPLQHIFATFAIISNAIFNALYAQTRCENIYDAIKNAKTLKDYIPSPKVILAQLLAFVSATANTYLAILAATNLLKTTLIFPTFIGPSLARAYTFELLIDAGIDSIKESFFSERPEVQRKILIIKLSQLAILLPKLESDKIISLHHLLCELPPRSVEMTATESLTRYPGTLFGVSIATNTTEHKSDAVSINRFDSHTPELK